MTKGKYDPGPDSTPQSSHAEPDRALPGPESQPSAREYPALGGKRPASDPQDGASPRVSSVEEPIFLASPPQLPREDCVEEYMATLALDPVKPAGQMLEKTTRSDMAARDSAELDADSAMMLRVRSGDDSAFNLLVEKYHRPMTHYMYRMTHNQAVAEELAQEVFLRVYRSRESYRAEARFSTWLYRIATNLGVNHARDTRHERSAHTVYLDQQDPETGTTPDVADKRPTAEQDMVREERMRAIRTQITALPERQRNAVLMHKYQGLDYRQIGEVLKLSESATKSLLFRAYQTLRERLKEFVEEN
jgi:RNA polymerase sigma-70 factor (ECF subfamily)